MPNQETASISSPLIDIGRPALNTPAKRSEQIKALTALRFFGVFFVVLDHAQGAFPWLALRCESIALCQAVTFFFVLSGFVLAYRYTDISGTGRITAFYVGRLARLWPIHIIGIVLLILLMPQVFKPTAGIYSVFLANFALVHSAVPIVKYIYSYNAPSWSSSTLLFLYLAFPLLAGLIRKSWLILLTATASGVILSIAVASYFNTPEADFNQVSTLGLLYVSPIARLFDFSLGMCAALLFKNVLKNLKKPDLIAGTTIELAAVAMLVFIAMSSFTWRYQCIDWAGVQGSYWLQNCGFALIGCLALVLAFSLESGLLSRLFRSQLFWLLGEISFCIYVLHTIFLVYGRSVLKMNETPETFAIYLVVLFGSALAMWWLVEKPSRKLAGQLARKFILSSSA